MFNKYTRQYPTRSFVRSGFDRHVDNFTENFAGIVANRLKERGYDIDMMNVNHVDIIFIDNKYVLMMFFTSTAILIGDVVHISCVTNQDPGFELSSIPLARYLKYYDVVVCLSGGTKKIESIVNGIINTITLMECSLI